MINRIRGSESKDIDVGSGKLAAKVGERTRFVCHENGQLRGNLYHEYGNKFY
jgi:hypothetical protein